MPDIPLDYKAPYAAKDDCKPYYEPIDLVITWVNGTDPDFLELLKKNNPENADETEASRFRDMNQLKPWVLKIVLKIVIFIQLFCMILNPNKSIQ